MVGRAGMGGRDAGTGGYGTGGYGSARSQLDDLNRPLYMIGVAAELAGVHPQTLRAYEQKGLVTPQRTSGGTRMYSQADIDRLHLINELTEEGINLAGVMRIIDLQSRLDESMAEASDLHKRVRRLADRLHEVTTRDGVQAIVRASAEEHAIIVRRVK